MRVEVFPVFLEPFGAVASYPQQDRSQGVGHILCRPPCAGVADFEGIPSKIKTCPLSAVSLPVRVEIPPGTEREVNFATSYDLKSLNGVEAQVVVVTIRFTFSGGSFIDTPQRVGRI